MRYIFSLTLLLLTLFSHSQNTPPKLVVGIVIDQMKYDYIVRFQDDFIEGGFKRLINDGFLYRNAHYNYIPTRTGPGHASIYTGTTPATHGIIGNSWYMRSLGKNMNCVGDSTVTAVGGEENSGHVSPRNLLTTTVTDELRLSTNMAAKVVGVSIKDRGACLPAGHNPTGAYWYDLETGNMITSTYYTEKLPDWVEDFNNKERFRYHLNQKWELFNELETYNESIADDNNFEQEAWDGFGTTFPYDYSKVKRTPRALKYSPFSNAFVSEFAQEAIIQEKMGEDDITDFITISFSGTDDLGHRFGPRSLEIQDAYLRLDYDISQLLIFLDGQLGKGNYTVFVTADHGGADVPSYSVSNKMVGGYYNSKYIRDLVSNGLAEKYGEGDWISKMVNDQIYLNHELIDEKKLDLASVQEYTTKILVTEPYITEAYTATRAAYRSFTSEMALRLQRGYNTSLSGDVLIVYKSGYLNDGYGRKGTDHRTGYTYDTHIPIIFYGNSIPKGNAVRRVNITDIAPTISTLLNITLPSGATGNPLIEIFE
ncbi:MAG: alkaline phosphatase PafA [Cyclobacteriaceae bacterium]